MLDPAICVKDLLEDANVGVFGTTTGWCLSVGHLPTDIDTVIVVNASPGGQSPYPHLLLNEPSVQVVVRGKKNGYVATSAKAREVVNVLLGMDSTVVGQTQSLAGDIYRSCNQLGDVSYLGQDDNTRPIFSMNFWFIVLPAAVAGGHRVAIT